MISFSKLYYFNTIVELGSISKASEVLFVTQSALSKSLRELEEELGHRLFNRVGKKLIINQRGIVLKKKTDEIFSIIDEIKPELDRVDMVETITLTIDTYYGFIFQLIFPVLMSYYPLIRFNALQTFNSPVEIINKLIAKEIDIGVISIADEEIELLKNKLENHSIKNLYLMKENLYISTPKGSYLENKKVCRLDEIDYTTIVNVSGGHYANIWFEQILRESMINFQYHSKLDMDTFISIWGTTAFSFVTTSLYINYEKYANVFRKYRNITKIDTPHASRKVYLFYNYNSFMDLDPLIKSFVKSFYKQFSATKSNF